MCPHWGVTCFCAMHPQSYALAHERYRFRSLHFFLGHELYPNHFLCSSLLSDLVLILVPTNPLLAILWPTRYKLKPFTWLTKLFMIWLLLLCPSTASYFPPPCTSSYLKTHALSVRCVLYPFSPLGLVMLHSWEFLSSTSLPLPLIIPQLSVNYLLRKPSVTTPHTGLRPPDAPTVTLVESVSQSCLP